MRFSIEHKRNSHDVISVGYVNLVFSWLGIETCFHPPSHDFPQQQRKEPNGKGEWATRRPGRDRFVLPSRLTVLQRFQCWTIDLTSYGQLVKGLKPANRFRRLWADYAIDRTVIVAELR
jgi:hypothetical protein